MLDMKTRCERCGTILPESDVAMICSFECTFCPNCAKWFQTRCPNCTTELVPRPRRGSEGEEREIRI
jgi:hypothetical protein